MPPIGTAASNPQSYFKNSSQVITTFSQLERNDLRSAIIKGFNLPEDDSYVYHAIASVTLSQVQAAVDAGTAHGLCDWYLDSNGASLGHPPPTDITAYTSLFSPYSVPSKALTSFSANARKSSLRSTIATYLQSKRYISPTFPSLPKPPKQVSTATSSSSSSTTTASTSPPPLLNPYLAFWSWSCHSLHWAGPHPTTSNVQTSHAILPIFMHHFGCVVPTREAIEVLRLIALDSLPSKTSPPRTILDIGSGNGYWSYILRAAGLDTIAIDNAQSVFRCNWVEDTIKADGVDFLKKRKGNGKEDVLLLVYPVVGGDFFRRMLDAYKGDWVVVAGTQCGNGYTGFKDRVVDEWMSEERKGEGWRLEVRVALPSFAGKDEGLFVFKRGEAIGGGEMKGKGESRERG